MGSGLCEGDAKSPVDSTVGGGEAHQKGPGLEGSQREEPHPKMEARGIKVGRAPHLEAVGEASEGRKKGGFVGSWLGWLIG
jgi:hypothetical protein